MELAIVARHAASFLAGKGLTVERIYAGTFLSSLDMAGISISVLGLNEDRLRWLNAETTAPLDQASKQRNPEMQRMEITKETSSISGEQTVAVRKQNKPSKQRQKL